jgi:cytochrome b561
MPADTTRMRIVARIIHWPLVVAILVSLGSGWLLHHGSTSDPDRSVWIDAHIALGIGCAILVLLRLLVWVIFRRPAAHDPLSPWHRQVENVAYILFYLFVVLSIVTGYLETAVDGTPISFSGIELPQWDAAPLFAVLPVQNLHAIVAYISSALIFIHIAISATNFLARRKIALVELGRAERRQEASAPDETKASEGFPLTPQDGREIGISKTAQLLARDLRLFGWIDCCVQLILGLIIALLMVFASSGVAFSPSRPGFGNAINWALVGFVLLCPAILLAYYYTVSSRKVVRSPATYLVHDKRLAFWYLWIGLVLGQLGIFVSFVGVAMSIALLVVKTISQPPGIAITDPNNIIRALDVFVLIANFMLLIAHFVGVVTALWLGFCAAKARVVYISIRTRTA